MKDALRFHHFRTGSVLALIAGERTMEKRFHLERMSLKSTRDFTYKLKYAIQLGCRLVIYLLYFDIREILLCLRLFSKKMHLDKPHCSCTGSS